MTIHRLRAHLCFVSDSGLAGWAQSNMDVRYQQAVDIRPGEAAEEPARSEIADDGDHQEYRCDLPLTDEDAAQDAFATLSDANVLGQAVAIPALEGDVPSWVEYHLCDHDEDPRSGCQRVSYAQQPV